MHTQPSRLRSFQLALVASAAVALGACSKSGDTDVPPPNAAASAPVSSVAMAPVTPAPAPVVVAQANTQHSYEQGRRDQERQDARRARDARELPPRADRDVDVADARYRHDQQVAAAACRECGVVESITPIEVQGQTNGVGAVAGGVGGALVGNRIAGSNNRTLGGVVGAVGGGLLGNAIEKHQRKTTVFDVNVRMQDGSLRTVRESTSPAVGEKVRVESDGLHERT